MCLEFPSRPTHVLTRLTNLSTDTRREQKTGDRNYELVPCPNQFKVTDPPLECTADSIFKTTRSDNEPSLSHEDHAFLEIMEMGIHKNASATGRCPSHSAMNVRPCQTTEHKPCSTYKDFLRHSPATPISQVSVTLPYSVQSAPGRSWYLAHFTTYHNTKHTIRVVFDSSCEFSGVSLNKVLLPGPDLMNNLLGVLMRFRKENVAVMCDVEQMFHSFHVNPAHRDFLRFLWLEGNDPSKPITEYRMNVHLFGNGPSPAVATYGLRRTAVDGEEEYAEEAKNFIYMLQFLHR